MEKKVDIERLKRHLSEFAWAPTVEISRTELLAVLSRLEQAEQATSTLEQDRDYWKASALDSDQAVQRVRDMAEEMGEAIGFDRLAHGQEAEYPVSYFRDKLEEALDGDQS